MKRCWLVEDWRRAHKWWSVRIAGLIAVAEPVYSYWDNAQAVLPPFWFRLSIAVLAVLVIVGRLKKQS